MSVAPRSILVRQDHSSHAAVVRCIGLDIIAGRHLEGARLPGDAELLHALGVSRSVLREALKTLTAKGLISARPRVGTRVRERSAWNMFDADILVWHLDAGIDARFLRDLAEIRLAVEPRAAALAAIRHSAADLAALRRSVAAMGSGSPSSEDFVNADLAFHLRVARASGNPFMVSIGGVIEAALYASFRLSAPGRGRDHAETVAAHARVVDAVAAGNAGDARDAMIAVIERGLRRHAVLR